MYAEIPALLVLQDRDRRLRTLTEELAKIPKDEARAKDKLQADLASVAKAKEALQHAEMEVKKVELDVATRKTTISRLRQQQFETRKNEEYTALGNEVVRYEKEVDELETRILELMEKVDAERGRHAQAEAALAQTQSLIQEDLATLATRKGNLEKDLAEAKQLRADQSTKVREDLLPLYEKLLKNKNGVALSPVNAGQCGGCHMKLVSSTLVKVQSAKDLVQCENCGRLLYQD